MSTIIYNFISTYLYHLLIFIFLSLALGGVGRGVLWLITKEKIPFLNIKSIVFGIASYALIALFASKILGVPMPGTAVTVLGLGFAYFIFTTIIFLKERRKITSDIWHDLLAMAVVSLVVIFVACFFGQTGKLDLVTFTLLDILSWSLMADVHRELASFDQVAAIFNKNLPIESDCILTYYTVALPGILLGTKSVYTLMITAVLFLVWIGLATIQALRQIYSLSYGYSIIGAILVVTSSMLAHIVFNGLLSQTLSTLVAIIFILVAVQNNLSLRSRIFLNVILFSFLQLAYPAGFLALLGICLSFILVYYFAETYTSNILSATIQTLKKVLPPVVIGLLLSFIVCYQELYYLVSRLLQVAGPPSPNVFVWPLWYIVHPLHMFFVPDVIPFDQNLPSYIEIRFYMFFFMVGLLILLNINKKIRLSLLINKISTHKKISLHLLLYIFYIGLYLLAYIFIGDLYQVWKFLTYSSIILSFIPLMIFLKCIESIKSPQTHLFIVCLVVFMAISSASFRMNKLDPYPEKNIAAKLQELSSLQESAANYQNLYLNLDDALDIQLAANLFAGKHKVYIPKKPSDLSYSEEVAPEQLAKLPGMGTITRKNPDGTPPKKVDINHKYGYNILPGFVENDSSK